MKRVKREKITRVFSKGYQQGVHGRSQHQCPYEGSTTKQQWLAGWREGRQDFWSGLGHTTALKRASV